MPAPPIHLDAVLFDLDNTLIDHEAAATRALTATFPGDRSAGPVDPDRLIRRWWTLETWAFDRYLAGELTYREQRRLRITRLADEYGLGTWTDEQADAWFAEYALHYQAAWQTYPDVTPTLSALAGEHAHLRLGVITNGFADQQRLKLQHVGLAGLLRHTTVSGEAGAAKPDPKIFQIACDELRLPPSRVAYVGDRLDIDAVAATTAGLHGIWLDRHDTGAEAPVPRIRTLTELVPLIGSIE